MSVWSEAPGAWFGQSENTVGSSMRSDPTPVCRSRRAEYQGLGHHGCSLVGLLLCTRGEMLQMLETACDIVTSHIDGVGPA